jgi:hypothetical protein
MHRNTLVALLFMILLPTLLWAQPDVLWIRTYDGAPVQAQGMDVQPLADGGFIVAAWVEPEDTLADAHLIRTDADGAVLWNRRYGHNAQFRINTLALGVLPDHDFLVYGVGNLPGSSLYSSLLLRTTITGDSVWCRAHRLPASISSVPTANLFLITRDGGSLLTRWAGSDIRMLHAFLVRSDSNGDTLWTRELCNRSDFRALSLLEHESGGFTVTGERVLYPWPGPWEFCAIELNAAGDSIGGSCGIVTDSYVRCAQADPTPDGGYLLTGCRNDSVWTYGNYWAARLNASLQTIWSRTYGGYSREQSSGGSNACLLLEDGGAVLAGGGRADILRISAQGDSLWSLDFDPAQIGLNRLRRTHDGGFIATGFQYLPDSNFVVLLRLAAEPESSEKPRSVGTASSFILSAYPNPFNPTTQLVFSLPKAQRVTLAVYDLNGQEVKMLVDDVMGAGEHRMVLDGSALPSGVYFARLAGAGISQTQKLLLLK